MEASNEGYLDTVRVLLEAKADPNITNEVNSKLSNKQSVTYFDAHLHEYVNNRTVKQPSFSLPKMIISK